MRSIEPGIHRSAERDASWIPGSCFARPGMTIASVHFFDRDRNALADADAHGCQGKLAAPLLHAVHRRQRQPRAAHAERMAERNRAAMRVDEVGVVLDAKLPQA